MTRGLPERERRRYKFAGRDVGDGIAVLRWIAITPSEQPVVEVACTASWFWGTAGMVTNINGTLPRRDGILAAGLARDGLETMLAAYRRKVS